MLQEKISSLDSTTTKSVELTEQDAAIIAVSLAFTSALVAGAIPTAVAIEPLVLALLEVQTQENADRLSTQLNSVADLLVTPENG